MYACFINISQGSVETHLQCDGIYNLIITLSQIVCRVCQWKNYEKRSIIGEDIDKSEVTRFLAHPVYLCLCVWRGFIKRAVCNDTKSKTCWVRLTTDLILHHVAHCRFACRDDVLINRLNTGNPTLLHLHLCEMHNNNYI